MKLISIRQKRWRRLHVSLITLLLGILEFIQITAFQSNNICCTTSRRHLYKFFINNDDSQNIVALSSQAEEEISSTIIKTNYDDDVSFTLPRFFEGEIEEGSYPSPLHTIHIRSILSDDEVSRCLNLATTYAQHTKCWDQPDLERHATYSTCDFPIEDNVKLMDYLQEIDFDQRLWETLEELYNVTQSDMTYLDFFCSHYQARQEQNDNKKINNTMDRLEAHRDGSLLSFTILLNSPTEFAGGGTFFDGLRDVVADISEKISNNYGVLHPGGIIRPLRAGDGCFHCGKILHGADVITSGNRTVLVGFVDVSGWVQRPGALSKACRDWGRMDVAAWRYKRQLEKCNSSAGGSNQRNQQLPGWFVNNARWIHVDPKNGRGRSCMQGFIPAFDSVKRRADPEYQRQRKLEAEDCLLRSILLQENESPTTTTRPGMDLFDGDITVL